MTVTKFPFTTKKEWTAFSKSLSSEQFLKISEFFKNRIKNYTEDDFQEDLYMHQQTAHARGYSKNRPVIEAITAIERFTYEDNETSQYNDSVTVACTGASGISGEKVSQSKKKIVQTANNKLLSLINEALES